MAPVNEHISSENKCLAACAASKDSNQKTCYHALLGLMLLLILTWGGNVEAEIYQWRDDNGRVHFSDALPVDDAVEANTVELQPISEYTSPPAHRQGWSPSSYASDSGAVSKTARANSVAAEQKSRELQQQRCAKYRDLYRKASKTLSDNIDDALKKRDKKNNYRNKIKEYCG
jgi:hypothetical protein